MTGIGEQLQLRGLNHLALVCSDMARTVDFYQGLLGLPLIKTVELPGGGQHFFFDIGDGASLAFFWFPDAPPVAPGVSQPAHRPGTGSITSGIGSMNHVAFDVEPDKIEHYRQWLVDNGIECSPVVNHDDSEFGVAREMHPGVFVRSVYFVDPDGFNLELAAWTKALGPGEVRHAPVTANGTPRPVAAEV
ncbi:MAG TPA: VOC family protein [Acidimicrobiales bacterium]|nr:VOC family protein [Acidimicrobiales bacterium]